MKKTAIIGVGRVAVLLEDDKFREKPATHMGAYLDSPDFEVVAAADIDEKRLATFGERYGVSALYTDYREMLEEVRPEVVSIAAYATERAEMLRNAILSGVKGIWCEKAFATTLAEADEIVELAKEHGTVITVSHMRRWSVEHILVKELLDSGAIGRLTSISAYFSGSLLHTGTHAFDLLRWFAGDALWVEGSLEGAPESSTEVEGTEKKDFLWSLAGDPGGRAVIKFKDGVYATLHAESKKYFLFEFDLFGTEGRIRIGNNDLLELYTEGESHHYEGIRELGFREFPEFNKANIWRGAAKNLSETIDGQAINMNPPEDGRAALELALAVHVSSSIGGRRVQLPLKDRSIRVNSR